MSSINPPLHPLLTTLVLPAAALAASLLAPADAEARPGYCGHDGQRPCNIWEAFPSCEGGLEENFLTNACQQPAPPPPAPAPLPACGALGARPCFFWERLPSCDPGLVEDILSNSCVTPPPATQPDPNLGCGYENQSPCPFGTALSSCAAGLKESFASPNLCVPLAPGEWSPFFAGLEGLNDSFQGLGSYARGLCRSSLGAQVQSGQALPFATMLAGAGGLADPGRVDPKCAEYVAVGFACEAPTLIELFDLGIDHTFLTTMQDQFNQAYQSPECSGAASLVERTSCAVGKMVFDAVIPPGSAQSMQCFVDAAQSPGVWEAMLGVDFHLDSEVCMDMGTALFDMSMLAIESRGKFAQGGADKDGAASWFASKRSQKYGNRPIGSTLDNHAKTGRLPARDAVTAAFEALGVTDAVVAQLDQIASCGVEPANAQAVVGGRTFYRVDGNGDLRMSQHDAGGWFSRIDQVVGWGWGSARWISAVSNNSVYMVDQAGTLKIFQHDGAGGWADYDGTEIGWGWGGFAKVFASQNQALAEAFRERRDQVEAQAHLSRAMALYEDARAKVLEGQVQAAMATLRRSVEQVALTAAKAGRSCRRGRVRSG